jgi:MoaA/NifB/PqqE/SkfB family radical SAM enzyme
MSKPSKDAKVISHVQTPDGQGFVRLLLDQNRYWIHRYAVRGRINNYLTEYEFQSSDGSSILKPITEDVGVKITQRIANGQNYSSAFLFSDIHTPQFTVPILRSEKEHKFTSTGIKFWRHKKNLENYKSLDPSTVISTHISPEGACNLKCPYCSVTYRDTFSRLPLNVVQDYVEKLLQRGLKAVILTGGGEPTVYRDFNNLVRFLKASGLEVALITNGTQTQRVEEDVWSMFDWIRVSINLFEDWENKIKLPVELIDKSKTTIGCSMVFTAEHESTEEERERLSYLNKVSILADKLQAEYVRMLPNCLLDQDNLLRAHQSLELTLGELKDERFFHQFKVHGAPKSSVCHQSYFRPYLSEEPYNGTPGAVYPCDSVVLNKSFQHFEKKYQLCHAKDILEYLDRSIQQKFDAKVDCEGCVFTSNVNLIDDYINLNEQKFDEFTSPLKHENFI